MGGARPDKRNDVLNHGTLPDDVPVLVEDVEAPEVLDAGVVEVDTGGIALLDDARGEKLVALDTMASLRIR